MDIRDSKEPHVSNKPEREERELRMEPQSQAVTSELPDSDEEVQSVHSIRDNSIVRLNLTKRLISATGIGCQRVLNLSSRIHASDIGRRTSSLWNSKISEQNGMSSKCIIQLKVYSRTLLVSSFKAYHSYLHSFELSSKSCTTEACSQRSQWTQMGTPHPPTSRCWMSQEVYH